MPNIEMPPAMREQLMGPNAIKSIEVNGHTYKAVEPVGHGYLGVVWKVRDHFGRLRAAKITTYEDFQGKSYLAEIELSSRLEQYALFTRIHDAGVAHLPGLVGESTFVCFVEDWVEGQTLNHLLTSASAVSIVTPSFLLAYVEQMCEALSVLSSQGLRHDDLHAGNVMIAQPLPGSLNDAMQIRLIDMGSLKEAVTPLSKARDDHEQFVVHLVGLRNRLARSPHLNHAGRKFLPEVDQLVRLMADDDTAVALRDPSQVTRDFAAAWTRSEALPTDQVSLMRTPFDFISAEHIADDSLLESIFAESCPWLPLIDTADPCLITGPRGCGKSTIFRWLSLKTHLHRSDLHIVSMKLIGFYISCSSDLQNRLGWITTDLLANTLRPGIIHYFNLIALREVTSTLLLITLRSDRDAFWGFGRAQEDQFYEYVMKYFRSNEKRLQGVPKLRQLLDLYDLEVFNIHQAMLRRAVRSDSCTPESFLGDLTTWMVQAMPRFKERKVTFLVDDFSIHRVPEPVQKVLNSVIWERRSSHIFKLSSEKLGATLLDVRNASADLTREMTEIDCGKEFLLLETAKGGKKRAIRFAVDLLKNRLKAAHYVGDPKILLGQSSWPERSLGAALAAKRKGRREDQYHGLDVISSLCSGDVSSLLYLYRKIFQVAGVTSTSTAPIEKNVQHIAIKEVSRKMTHAIQLTHPRGKDCYSVLVAFGQLVRLILVQGKMQTDEHGKSVPSQAPRIELDRKRVSDELTGSVEELRRELLRRAIFIDLDAGTSRHNAAPTVRWNLRRIYLPQFSAAITKNDAIKEDYDWLKYLLTSPDKACEAEWKRWPKEVGSGRTSASSQQSLRLED